MLATGERGGADAEKTFCFWKSVRIKCIVLPVRIHLKTFMGRQWLYLERLSVLRYSWEEHGVNIAPETLSISKLFGMLRFKSQSTALMVYGISCDTSCVSVLRICFELWGKYITGWYLSISDCLHNGDKKVTILFQNCKYSRSHLKSHCCHWLICHFSSRKTRVIPPNTSDPPDSSPLKPRVPFTFPLQFASKSDQHM